MGAGEEEGRGRGGEGRWECDMMDWFIGPEWLVSHVQYALAQGFKNMSDLSPTVESPSSVNAFTDEGNRKFLHYFETLV